MKYDRVLSLVRPAASLVVLSREKVLTEAALHPDIRRGLHISGSAYTSAALRHTWEIDRQLPSWKAELARIGVGKGQRTYPDSSSFALCASVVRVFVLATI